MFTKRDTELRAYFLNNRSATEKERLFYVVQSDRLQCLNGAYLSQVSMELARLLLDQPMYSRQRPFSLVREVSAGERLQELFCRVGQSEFSDRVRKNTIFDVAFPTAMSQNAAS